MTRSSASANKVSACIWGRNTSAPLQIMGLPRSQEEGQRIAKSVDHGMDLGAQSAFAAPDRLVFAVCF
jgi:hypothetical protein